MQRNNIDATGTPGPRVVADPSELTASGLAAMLGSSAVDDFTVERIGTGQMSDSYRLALRYVDGPSAQGPASVVLKVAASDPTSRQTGLALGLYEREVRFYTDVAPRLGPAVAHCYDAQIDLDTGVFHLLIGDAAPATVGDELVGASIDQARLAVDTLAGLQAPLLGDAALADAPWLNRAAPLNQGLITGLYAGFTDRYRDVLTDQQRLVCDRLVGSFDGYLAAESAPGRPHGLVHGDYRLDNLLFGTAGAPPLTVVDWQTVSWGPAMTDLAYFLGGALPVELRREHHHALLRVYHAGLGPDAPLSLDEVAEGVRRQSFFGVMMAIVSAMLVERTDRGDAMFMTLLDRHTHHVLDTGALDALPAAATVEPLQPDPADEYAHPPGPEPLWNESWYFDFVDPDQQLAGWIRLGLNPNGPGAWINAMLCGPGHPTIALNDFQVPHPADPTDVHGDGVALTQQVLEPLQTYRVQAGGAGQAFTDPSALLHGGTGTPVEAAMELEFTTVGTPYQYRVTPRYEIPCTVSGEVRIGENRYRLRDVVGQRDHSWGVRDWWGMDWVWNALHLDDGTHIHGVEVRLPQAGPLGIGYVQTSGRPLTELRGIVNRETIADNGLPTATDVELTPGDLTVSATPVAHAPVTLQAVDGRVSHFPRAWVQITTADGRRGHGWMEWNRNQRPVTP
ncbi:phosphotransferase [Mycolicibacillus koreensis]|nr:phosphotransferase [Mycolicibacillus koreensis]